MSTTFVLVWAVILLGIIAVGSFAWRSANKRRASLDALVARMGFAYVLNDPDLLDRFAAIGDPFDRGFDRRASNVLAGIRNGRPALAFDFSYRTRSDGGKTTSTTTHHLGIVCVNSGLLMAQLSVLPDRVVTRAIDALLDDDIQLDSDEFNRTFSVTAANPRVASEVLDRGMMAYLLFHPHEGLKIDGDQMMRVTPGHFQPAQLRPALAYLDAVLDRIPERVRRTLRASDQG